MFELYADEESKSDTPLPIVIGDIRFLNEAEAIKSRGGIIIRIVRTDDNENNTNGDHANHESEMEMDQIKADFMINNVHSINNLYATIDNIMNHRDDLD